VAAVVVIALAAAAWLLLRGGPTSAQIARGAGVYAEHCATCHGTNLQGQPDWQFPLSNGRMPAPPHDETGHTWHHPDQILLRIVKEGIVSILPGYETDMPPYQDILSDDDIAAVLTFIKSRWPKREREYQEARTREGAIGAP